MAITIEEALRRLAEDYGLNANVTGFLDCGFTAKLGDPLNGILAERSFTAEELGEVGDWLLAEAAKPHPQVRAALDQDTIDRVIEEIGIEVDLDARKGGGSP